MEGGCGGGGWAGWCLISGVVINNVMYIRRQELCVFIVDISDYHRYPLVANSIQCNLVFNRRSRNILESSLTNNQVK